MTSRGSDTIANARIKSLFLVRRAAPSLSSSFSLPSVRQECQEREVSPIDGIRRHGPGEQATRGEKAQFCRGSCGLSLCLSAWRLTHDQTAEIGYSEVWTPAVHLQSSGSHRSKIQFTAPFGPQTPPPGFGFLLGLVGLRVECIIINRQGDHDLTWWWADDRLLRILIVIASDLNNREQGE